MLRIYCSTPFTVRGFEGEQNKEQGAGASRRQLAGPKYAYLVASADYARRENGYGGQIVRSLSYYTTRLDRGIV